MWADVRVTKLKPLVAVVFQQEVTYTVINVSSNSTKHYAYITHLGQYLVSSGERANIT